MVSRPNPPLNRGKTPAIIQFAISFLRGPNFNISHIPLEGRPLSSPYEFTVYPLTLRKADVATPRPHAARLQPHGYVGGARARRI